jgi:hypothetical protein
MKINAQVRLSINLTVTADYLYVHNIVRRERSYTVRTGDGTQYRRNRRHLLKTNESLCEKSMFVTRSLIFWIKKTPI